MVDSLGRSKKMYGCAVASAFEIQTEGNLTLECRNESMTERSVEGVTDEVIRTLSEKVLKFYIK